MRSGSGIDSKIIVAANQPLFILTPPIFSGYTKMDSFNGEKRAIFGLTLSPICGYNFSRLYYYGRFRFRL
jgi:hypothetical protein